jgi:ATPase subunit of ABC transporter with duplicated ATPase domains
VKFYGANKIFENISFDIKTGEHIGLIGKNGCGKTNSSDCVCLKELFEKQEAASKELEKAYMEWYNQNQA